MWLILLIFGLVAALVPWFADLLSPWHAGLRLFVGLFIFLINKPLAAAFVALALANLNGHHYLQQRLPSQLEGVEIYLSGCVTSLVNIYTDYQQFLFDIDSAQQGLKRLGLNGVVSLGDYNFYEITPGFCYQLPAKLKRVHRNVNFETANRERNDIAIELLGRGYVRAQPQGLGRQSGLSGHILRLRHQMQETVVMAPLSENSRAWLAALVLGDKSGLRPEQWQVLQRTGTVHVVVVSGLHVGLFAAVGAALFYMLSWCWPNHYGWLSRRGWAALGSLVFGGCFALLTGMGLPVQRALLMLVVFVVASWCRLAGGPWWGWVIALCVVVIWQPFSSLSLGFLLSFGLVAGLLAGTSAQVVWWRNLLSAQWRCMLASTPMLLASTGSISLLAPLVNVLFVPLLALILPMVLLMFLVSLLMPSVWTWLDALFWGIEFVLVWLAELSWSLWQPPRLDAGAWLCLLFAIFVMLTPRVWPWRYLALIPLLQVFLAAADEQRPGLQIDFFDVGQGSAVLLQTPSWRAVYDTGPRYGEYSAMQTIILPVLARLGISRLDRVWVSHRDMDHVGGLQPLTEQLAIGHATLPINIVGGDEVCSQGQNVGAVGLQIDVLWPPRGYHSSKTNNTSCVIQLSYAGRRILLPGDIEQVVEDTLLVNGALTPVDIVAAPHHGSKTSSSQRFVNAISPVYVVIEAGYLNRYGHPADVVSQRYRTLGTRQYSTAKDGGVRFYVDPHGNIEVQTARQQRRYFWFDSMPR